MSLCRHWRHWSAWAFAQADQGLQYLPIQKEYVIVNMWGGNEQLGGFIWFYIGINLALKGRMGPFLHADIYYNHRELIRKHSLYSVCSFYGKNMLLWGNNAIVDNWYGGKNGTVIPYIAWTLVWYRAQWLIGSVLDLGSKGCGFETQWWHCVVSLSKTFYPLL